MKISAKQIAEALQGKTEGDESVLVDSLSKIEEGCAGSVTFLANPKYEHYIYGTKASVVIVNEDFVLQSPVSATLIRVGNAYTAFTQLLDFYNQYRIHAKVGVESPSFVGENVTMGKDIYLGAFAYVGNHVTIGNNVKIYPHVWLGDHVTIGDNTILYPDVKLYSETVIGSNCMIHAGTVIGADGFGFAPQADGTFKKIPQIGNVVIEDDVEIGSCTTIDRATMGSTVIRRGAKLDNHIQIAHNVEIGENTVMASQSGVAGSTKVGKNCMLGGQVGVSGHLKIGDGAQFAAQTGVMNDVADGMIMMGSPAMEHRTYFKSQAVFRNLPELSRTVNRLNKKLNNSENSKK